MERLRRLRWNGRTVPPERARRLTGIRIFADHFLWILGGIVLICAAVGGTLLVCRRKAVVKAECEADETEENEEDQEA